LSKTYISKALRSAIAADANYRCGYCHLQQAVIGAELEIDHIIPESLGGRTETSNLWLACSPCNDRKGDRIAGFDPDTHDYVHIFHPRSQKWDDHFVWSYNGERILARTPTGRATVIVLDLNRPVLIRARRLWVKAGWHPPKR